MAIEEYTISLLVLIYYVCGYGVTEAAMPSRSSRPLWVAMAKASLRLMDATDNHRSHQMVM